MRLTIPKTYKMYVGGAFIRSEGGYVHPFYAKNGDFMANVPTATRKDFRDAVLKCRGAQSGWAKRTAFNRGQILFRIAEMLEARKSEFVALLQAMGYSEKNALQEVEDAGDVIFYYAGWADKFQQSLSAVNPIAGPYFNFTLPEATGVVFLFPKEEKPLLDFVQSLMPVLVGGNAAISLHQEAPLIALTFAEVIATSDVPNGMVNILSGNRAELLPHVGGHFDVNAVLMDGLLATEQAQMQTLAADNFKRIYTSASTKANLFAMLPTLEFKTTWHPIDKDMAVGSKY